MSRLLRPRLTTSAIFSVCLILLLYFLWFDAYSRARRSIIFPKPHSEQPHQPPSKILLVSALFPLPQSKHTQTEYKEWLQHFLGTISTDIYFYTTPSLEPLAQTLHPTYNPTRKLIINTTFSSPFDIPPLLPFKEKYTEMHEWDREKDRHTPELYAVWNAKPWFLDQAVRNTRHMAAGGEGYEYAFWVDAGSLRRYHTYSAWPDLGRVEEVWEEAWIMSRKEGLKGQEDLMFFPVFELPGRGEVMWRKEMGPVDIDFSEGTFFGSTPATISWYTALFYRYHDHYISTPPPPPSSKSHHPHTPKVPPPPFHFVGKDQTLINSLLFLYPHRFFTVVAPERRPSLPPLPPTPSTTTIAAPSSSSSSPSSASTTLPAVYSISYTVHSVFSHIRTRFFVWARGKDNSPCGDQWFYFQFWLAGAAERFGMTWNMWPMRSSGEGILRRWGQRIVRWFEGRMWEGEVGTQCAVERVVTIEGVLEGLFGRRWVERVRAGGD